MAYKYSLFIIWFCLFAVSCQKKDDTEPQPSKVNIEISSPHPSASFKNGDTINISAAVSYISQLHGYEIRITDKNTGALITDLEGHVHTDKFNIEESWVNTLNYYGTLKIEVIAIIDHDGNEARAEVEILSQP